MAMCFQLFLEGVFLLSQSTNPFHEELHFSYTLIRMDTLYFSEIPCVKSSVNKRQSRDFFSLNYFDIVSQFQLAMFHYSPRPHAPSPCLSYSVER